MHIDDALTGVIVSFNAPDGLGEVELSDGQRMLFGLRACHGLYEGRPSIGTRVRVSDIRTSPTGRRKAYRVECLEGRWHPDAKPVDDEPVEDRCIAPLLDPARLEVHVPPPGLAALDELDRVDWSRLEHAYGRGDEGPLGSVPEILRGLVSEDPERSEPAYFDGLLAVVWHQGSVFTSTVHAVPFLAAFVASPACPGAANILAGLLVIVHDAYLYGGPDGAQVLAATARADELLDHAAKVQARELAEACRLIRDVVDRWRSGAAVPDDLLATLMSTYARIEV